MGKDSGRKGRMPWGIAPTASEIEKIKAESSDMLNGLESCGDLEYSTYSYLWDFYYELLDKAYEQGRKDVQTAEAIPIDWLENFRDGLDTLSESKLMGAIDLIIDAYRAERKRGENEC